MSVHRCKNLWQRSCCLFFSSSCPVQPKQCINSSACLCTRLQIFDSKAIAFSFQQRQLIWYYVHTKMHYVLYITVRMCWLPRRHQRGDYVSCMAHRQSGAFFFWEKKRKMQTTNYYIYQNKFKYICIPIKKYLCVGQADSAKYFQNFNHKELFKCLMYKRNGIHKFSMKRNYNNIVYLLYFLNLF